LLGSCPRDLGSSPKPAITKWVFFLKASL